MTRWTVSFEATATVNVDADTEDQALESAEKTLRAVSFDGLRFCDISHCCVDISIRKDQ
jgi:hypothetical protein